MRAVVTPFSSIMYYRSIHPLNLIWFWWLHYKKIILCVGTLYINVRNQIWSQFQVHYMFYMKCFTIMEMGFCLPKSGGTTIIYSGVTLSFILGGLNILFAKIFGANLGAYCSKAQILEGLKPPAPSHPHVTPLLANFT